MLKKISAALLASFLVTGGVAQAYDLPKLKPDKKVSQTAQQKKPMLKSDWQGAELFEQTIKARVPTDKNYVFVAFYNDAPYFLDKYSIKIIERADGVRIWEQNIFPITKNFSPQNATSTHQKFCLADGKFYNATKAKDALSEVADEADRIFLQECFKIGYYFAFGEEATNN